MTSDYERELRDRLGVALDTVEPSLPPTSAIMRRGRTIRAWRRGGLAAALAVLAVLAATLPGVIEHRSAPLQHHRDRVTVNPARVTAKKVIFSGTINARPWRFSLSYSGRAVVQTGPGSGPGTIGASGTFTGPQGDPAAFQEIEGAPATPGGQVLAMAGQVRKDVVQLVLRLPGGTRLELDPVRWHGHRWVGAVVPARMQLGSITAYSSRGEIAYAIPFGHNDYNRWLRPGQRGLPRQRVRVGSGTLHGKHWSVLGSAGPWGLCFADPGGSSYCLGDQGSVLRNGALTAGLTCGGEPNFVTAQAAGSVRYLQVRLSDGTVHHIATVRLAGYRYYAFAMAAKVRLVSWTAYGATGQRLGSGKGFQPPC